MKELSDEIKYYRERAQEAGVEVDRPADEPGDKVVVTDIDMKFGSMVLFMVKWVLASIPAVIILCAIGFAALTVFGVLSVA